MTAVPSDSGSAAAIVVAGGSARRMGGVDKPALEVGGRSLLDHVLAAVRPRCEAVVVVGRQRPSAVDGVAYTAEAQPGGGPVPAVAAGLATLDGHTLVSVLAADLPLLTTAHLEALFEAMAGASADAAAAADPRGRPHPLLAVHRIGPLRARVAELKADPGLAGLPASRLLPPDVVLVALDAVATLDVNRPEDLERVRALMGSRP